MPRSGNFADVHEFHCPATNRKWAIKCFTRKVPGLRDRYAAISAYLKQVNLLFILPRDASVGHWAGCDRDHHYIPD